MEERTKQSTIIENATIQQNPANKIRHQRRWERECRGHANDIGWKPELVSSRQSCMDPKRLSSREPRKSNFMRAKVRARMWILHLCLIHSCVKRLYAESRGDNRDGVARFKTEGGGRRSECEGGKRKEGKCWRYIKGGLDEEQNTQWTGITRPGPCRCWSVHSGQRTCLSQEDLTGWGWVPSPGNNHRRERLRKPRAKLESEYYEKNFFRFDLYSTSLVWSIAYLDISNI